MEAREIARGVRLSQWAVLLREQKDSGMSIKNWCEDQGISRARYFYWQKKLRAAALEELGKRDSLTAESPPGWALCTTETRTQRLETTEETCLADQITVEVQGIRLTGGSAYPVEKLAQLIRELMS